MRSGAWTESRDRAIRLTTGTGSFTRELLEHGRQRLIIRTLARRQAAESPGTDDRIRFSQRRDRDDGQRCIGAGGVEQIMQVSPNVRLENFPRGGSPLRRHPTTEPT